MVQRIVGRLRPPPPSFKFYSMTQDGGVYAFYVFCSMTDFSLSHLLPLGMRKKANTIQF